jgi:ubiquinone/menaquinone biosynthesis C-methylase UbiE/uncharacterized protein YbaR (Trm112 family)
VNVFDEDLQLLRCPEPHCRTSLRREAHALVCHGCGVRWPIQDGLARLFREEEVRGNDRLLRAIYNTAAALHDPAVRWLIPLFQTEGSEYALRHAYTQRMQLQALKPREDGRPLRILEIGVGTGANLSWLRSTLPHGIAVEYWAMDLSEGMLKQLVQRVSENANLVVGDGRMRLVMADAHALPYADESFDRVFHVGGMGGYRDPARALAEMARVAVRETPIVVVDEQLDAGRSHTLYHRLMFRAVTFYDRNPHCPREMVPAGAVDVVEEQASRFFYCLSFRMPSVS